jgi:hypothetical protein
MTIQELLAKKVHKVRNTKGVGVIEIIYKDDKPFELFFCYPKRDKPEKVLAKDAKNILESVSSDWEAVVEETSSPKKKK